MSTAGRAHFLSFGRVGDQPGEPGPLADALARLIARPAEREAMGAAGHALYQRRFSIEACAGAFLEASADMLPAAEEAAAA